MIVDILLNSKSEKRENGIITSILAGKDILYNRYPESCWSGKRH